MSHYVECIPGFKDQQALIEALVAVGFERSHIEVHAETAALYGYQGDERPQRAHIVIRREHVGTAANDVGWERMPDGTFRAWISEYDARHRFKRPRCRTASSRSTPITPYRVSNERWDAQSSAASWKTARSRCSSVATDRRYSTGIKRAIRARKDYKPCVTNTCE